MVTLPTGKYYWRLKNGSDSSWTEGTAGTPFSPTDGAEVEVKTLTPSQSSFIVADTNPAAGTIQNVTAPYGTTINVNGAAGFTGTNLVYSLKTKPSYLAINASTGAITGTAPNAISADNVVVRAVNSAGDAETGFTVNVTDNVPAYDPSTDLATMDLWLDPSDAASITSSSNRMSQINDKSGNNRHYTQSDDAKKPMTGLARIGSRNCLMFDGVDDLMVGSPFLYQTGARTTYIVMKTPPVAPSDCVILSEASSSSGNPRYVQSVFTTGQFSQFFHRTGGNSVRINNLRGTFPLANHGVNILTSTDTGDTTGAVYTSYINGTQDSQTTYNRATSAFDISSIGAQKFQTSEVQHIEMRFGEILSFRGVHDAAKRAQVEVYLRNRWKEPLLRAASVQNRLNRTLVTPAGNNTHYAVRWPHVIGQDMKSIALNFHNITADNSDTLKPNDNAINVVSASVQAPDGTVVPVTFYQTNQRNRPIPANGVDINSNAIPKASFPNGINRGDIFWAKVIFSVPAVGNKMSIQNALAIAAADVSGSQCGWYDPAVTTISSTDAAGVYTATGTALTSETTGPRPMMIGEPEADGKTFILCGDSILENMEDAANGVFGKGFAQRSMVDASNQNPYPCINLAVSSTTGALLNTRQRWYPYIRYAKHMIEEYGTNQMFQNGTAAAVYANSSNIWAFGKQMGIQKIIRCEYVPKTSSTDNWATNANQSPQTGYEPNGVADQLRDMFINAKNAGTINEIMQTTAVREPGNYYNWAVPKLYNQDGTHPNAAGHAALRPVLRALVESL